MTARHVFVHRPPEPTPPSLTLTPTDELLTVEGAKTRVWVGTLPDGTPVEAYLVRAGDLDDHGVEMLRAKAAREKGGVP